MIAPATHAAGLLGVLGVIDGQTIHFHDGFDASTVLDAIENNLINGFFLPPTAFYALVDEQRRRPRDITSLECLLVGAAPISPERLAEGAELFGWKVAQAFGQTEAPCYITFQQPEDIERAVKDGDAELLRSCGKMSPVVRVSIQDPDGNILPHGEPGEICVRGELVTSEYLGNPEATAEAHRGGW